ncbi:uncharacterized protein LOC117167047 [Belonocnema kinseyi]|uniref:uncharacterized protein LOC117167047 n=1 Tax=Belonocnema kinseyi TaxID=2817044 RepID=UPI00143CDA0E|nr:uncharacterized protein LOC117167047 [Belonocnema kinseyi]XP_033207513.1 uncharacterized protein LOC117167047 [Belonocnema kinseyi]
MIFKKKQDIRTNGAKPGNNPETSTSGNPRYSTLQMRFDIEITLFTLAVFLIPIEFSLQSLDIEPRDPERQMNVQYYEDDHNNLIPIMAARLRLLKDWRELFYIGLQIAAADFIGCYVFYIIAVLWCCLRRKIQIVLMIAL